MGPVILARPSPTVSTKPANRVAAPGWNSRYSGALVPPGSALPRRGCFEDGKSPKYRLPSLCSGQLRAEEEKRNQLKTGCRDTRPGRALQPAVRVALALAVGALSLACSQREGASSSSPERPIEASNPELRHASWKITTAATGAVGRVTRIEKKRIEDSRPQLKELVRKVYDSLFSSPRDRKAAVAAHFAKRAGGLWLSTSSGATAEVDRVRALSRKAAITIHRDGGRRATVRVRIRAKATGEGRQLRFLHEATLWVERSRSRWKVIAFDLLQRPLKRTSGRAESGLRDKRDEGTPGKKGAGDEAARKKRGKGADK
jgi:hypothetical protein